LVYKNIVDQSIFIATSGKVPVEPTSPDRKATLSRQYFSSAPGQPFSDAVLIDGKTLYLAGRIGLKPGMQQVPETIEEETTLLMEGLIKLLGQASMSTANLTFVQVFCPDVSLWDRFNAIYAKYFTGPLPPRAFVGSGALLFGAHFELQGIAVHEQTE